MGIQPRALREFPQRLPARRCSSLLPLPAVPRQGPQAPLLSTAALRCAAHFDFHQHASRHARVCQRLVSTPAPEPDPGTALGTQPRRGRDYCPRSPPSHETKAPRPERICPVSHSYSLWEPGLGGARSLAKSYSAEPEGSPSSQWGLSALDHTGQRRRYLASLSPVLS